MTQDVIPGPDPAPAEEAPWVGAWEIRPSSATGVPLTDRAKLGAGYNRAASRLALEARNAVADPKLAAWLLMVGAAKLLSGHLTPDRAAAHFERIAAIGAEELFATRGDLPPTANTR